jgi:hydrogenase maturation protease
MLDAHDLSPGGVMALVPTLGGAVGRVVVVGCRPGSLAEGIGLTEAVRAAVEPAADLVVDVVRDMVGDMVGDMAEGGPERERRRSS